MTVEPWPFRYRATVVRVIDGDTFYLTVDHGMRLHSTQSVRLAGVNTPEIYGGTEEEKSAGRAARSFVIDWMENAPDVAWPLQIQTYKDKQSFNRYVADVTDTAGRNLADDIIAAGHGEPA